MGQYAFGLSLVLAFVIIGRSLMDFLVQFGQLRTRQTRVEYELDQRVADLPEKRERIEAVAGLLPPLKRRNHQLRGYFGTLRDIELEFERQKMEQSEEGQAEARKEIDVQQRERRPEDFDKTVDREIEVQQRKTGWEHL